MENWRQIKKETKEDTYKCGYKLCSLIGRNVVKMFILIKVTYRLSVISIEILSIFHRREASSYRNIETCRQSIYFLIFRLMHISVCSHVCLCTTVLCMAVSHHLGAGTWTLVLCQNQTFYGWATSPAAFRDYWESTQQHVTHFFISNYTQSYSYWDSMIKNKYWPKMEQSGCYAQSADPQITTLRPNLMQEQRVFIAS